MARIPVGDALQIVLMFRLRFPEGTRRSHLRHHSPGPQTRRVDIGDGVLGNSPLLVAGREDGGAVARPQVVALVIAGRWIVNLEEEVQQLAKDVPVGMDDDLGGLRVGYVVVIFIVGYCTS